MEEEKANVARGLVFWMTGGEYFLILPEKSTLFSFM